MKIQTKLLAVLTFFILINLNVSAQTEKPAEEPLYPETVIIKVVEHFGTRAGTPSKICIIKQGSTSVETKLMETSRLSTDDSQDFDQNFVKFKNEIQKWRNDGYKVKTSSSASPYDGVIISTYILEKN